MKHMVFLAIALFAGAAWAQAPKEPAKEAAKPEAMKEAAKAKKPQQPRRWNEDARHCLERTSNTEVIKCAEEFL